MTTAVAVTPRPPAPLAGADFAAMLAFADQLVKTNFLPAAVKTPAQCVAIILTGQELGLGPMQALRSINIINGKPVVAADLQLALFKRAGGRAHFTTLNESVATLQLRGPNGDAHTETFTLADAKKADLTKNATWSKYPKAMLRSRAITAGLKSIGFEPCAGLYDPHELGGDFPEPLDGEDVPDVVAVAGDVEEATPEPITPETPLPSGPRKGEPLKTLTPKQLTWHLEHGEAWGECRDDEDAQRWVEACRGELVRRERERHAMAAMPAALLAPEEPLPFERGVK